MASTAKNNITRSAGQIRIIGGRWRGRKLPVLDSPGLRPTPDRIRETLFNWLAPVIQGARCLDCFSGSGALGIESLSRAAASVVLLERNREVSKQLIHNLLILQSRLAKVITTDSLRWLARPGAIFDIVFIDPPFRRGMITSTIFLLEQYQHLANDAWIYIETEIEGLSLKVPDYWQLHREKIARQVAYRLYIRHAGLESNATLINSCHFLSLR